MDGEEPVVIQEKLNYYIVLQNNHLTVDKIENDIKALLPFHKSLQIAERDENTVAVIIIDWINLQSMFLINQDTKSKRFIL